MLILASTTSWTVEKHYCMGRIMDVAINHEAQDCGMQLMNTDENLKMDCCSDEIAVIQGQDDLKITFEDLSIDEQFFAISFIYSYINLFEVLKKEKGPHIDYPPPNLVQDIQLLNQVFLI